jgi:hypothetical protein
MYIFITNIYKYINTHRGEGEGEGERENYKLPLFLRILYRIQ